MKKKLLGLALIVCMLVTLVPTMFLAAETQTKTVKAIAYAEDAVSDTTPLEGVKLTLALCNEKTGTGTLLTESTTTGTNSCNVTYNSDGKFVYDGQEYTYLRVTVYAKVDGYETIPNRLYTYTAEEFDAIRPDENNVVTFKYMVEKAKVYTEEIVAEKEGVYTVGRSFCDGIYDYTYVSYESETFSSSELVEALACLTETDTNVELYIYACGDGFPTISKEAMAMVAEKSAYMIIYNRDTYEELEWGVDTCESAFELKITDNASVTGGLDAAKIPYHLYSVSGCNGAADFMAGMMPEFGVLDAGEYNADVEQYVSEKFVYYYDAVKNVFTLCELKLEYVSYIDEEYPEDNQTYTTISGDTFPYDGYYVIVDEALPAEFTEVKEAPKDEPKEDVVISQQIADSKEVVELVAEANVVPEDAKLSVEKIEDGKAKQQADEALKYIVTDKTSVHLFDITLLDSANVKIQPDGKVTITVTLEKELKATDKVTVFRIENDGTRTKMIGAKVVDGKVVFTTDHFSIYAIILGDIVEVPDTGDNSSVGLYMAFMVLGVAVVLANKKQFTK